MELRTAPERYLINDPVGVYERHDPATITYGRIESMGFTADEGIMVRTAEGELTGPWIEGKDVIFFDATAHANYPHHPGTLYDCPGCEAIMDKDANGDYVDSEGSGQHE